jgi:hypothetical protein
VAVLKLSARPDVHPANGAGCSNSCQAHRQNVWFDSPDVLLRKGNMNAVLIVIPALMLMSLVCIAGASDKPIEFVDLPKAVRMQC